MSTINPNSTTHAHFLATATIWGLYYARKITARKRDRLLNVLRATLTPAVLTQ